MRKAAELALKTLSKVKKHILSLVHTCMFWMSVIIIPLHLSRNGLLQQAIILENCLV